MERRLHHLPNQSVTLAEMGLALIRILSNIPQAFFNNLVRSMRRRCQACINANGMVTRQHFTVSDSHELLTQHVFERCPAEM
jgi:hypothetical protein